MLKDEALLRIPLAGRRQLVVQGLRLILRGGNGVRVEFKYTFPPGLDIHVDVLLEFSCPLSLGLIQIEGGQPPEAQSAVLLVTLAVDASFAALLHLIRNN